MQGGAYQGRAAEKRRTSGQRRSQGARGTRRGAEESRSDWEGGETGKPRPSAGEAWGSQGVNDDHRKQGPCSTDARAARENRNCGNEREQRLCRRPRGLPCGGRGELCAVSVFPSALARTLNRSKAWRFAAHISAWPARNESVVKHANSKLMVKTVGFRSRDRNSRSDFCNGGPSRCACVRACVRGLGRRPLTAVIRRATNTTRRFESTHGQGAAGEERHP